MSTQKRAFKLKLLLAIDTAFLFLELGVGTVVGSLALVADSFHILIVALQALKLAETSAASSKFSYGWQRAEVLGALINGVFLLALCFSIGMEAIARFVNYTGQPRRHGFDADLPLTLLVIAEVTQPKLIVAVGTAGLISNIVGLFLFHDHGGHSHGGGSSGHGHGHLHGNGNGKKAASEHNGRNHASHADDDRTPLLRNGSALRKPGAGLASESATASGATTPAGSDAGTDVEEFEAPDAEDELCMHPGALRASVVKKAHDAGYGATTTGGSSQQGHVGEHDVEAGLGGSDDHGHSHGGHGGHGHSTADGSMNMRGVFLHVLGDALGNVGVIAAGLFIWLTDYWWKMYFDPAVSLVITIIIKSASFVLLQGVPSSVPLDRLRSSIASVPGVINVHDLHVWSLSESKIVASVHIMVKGPDLVKVSKEIKRRFHRFGIHASTIQPEIVESGSGNAPGQIASALSHISASAAAEIGLEEEGCAVLCGDDQSCQILSCCPPATGTGTNTPTRERTRDS
ncbi:transporter of heavy metals [Rhodotorula taiwanensis]|uniref:Transporter of heavy metals n=1 Tax=Rhodotorula taiwanensis TaxID=741276 RepID=A0A2S5BHS9_9BASI|nr:transporter of heavy metals [Rhodotorula taiwanensis]